MLNFLGENYYIDVDELETQVSLVNSKLPMVSGETENEQQISVTRYETFKSLIEVVLTEREELDENLGIHSAKNLTIPFKIAFNTLLINKIIKTL
jgi:transcription termination factor NusB